MAPKVVFCSPHRSAPAQPWSFTHKKEDKKEKDEDEDEEDDDKDKDKDEEEKDKDKEDEEMMTKKTTKKKTKTMMITMKKNTRMGGEWSSLTFLESKALRPWAPQIFLFCWVGVFLGEHHHAQLLRAFVGRRHCSHGYTTSSVSV